MRTLFAFCSVLILTSDLINALTRSDLPRPGQCGTQIKQRIIGGELTSIVDYPWMALLYYPKPNESKINTRNFLCGGTLINKNYVITAAHCVKKKGTANHPTSVRLSEHDLTRPEDCEDGECKDPPQDVPVTEWIIHEKYIRASSGYDIALLRLQRNVDFTDWVRPICLPFNRDVNNKNLDRVSLIVAGYGKTRTSRQSTVLLKLEIDGFNLNSCKNIYRSKYGIALTERQICAGGDEGQDSCNGDSGGPLMGEVLTSSLDAPPYTYLAGIVSIGPTKCASRGIPAVYTRIDQYLDWIVNKMKP